MLIVCRNFVFDFSCHKHEGHNLPSALEMKLFQHSTTCRSERIQCQKRSAQVCFYSTHPPILNARILSTSCVSFWNSSVEWHRVINEIIINELRSHQMETISLRDQTFVHHLYKHLSYYNSFLFLDIALRFGDIGKQILEN